MAKSFHVPEAELKLSSTLDLYQHSLAEREKRFAYQRARCELTQRNESDQPDEVSSTTKLQCWYGLNDPKKHNESPALDLITIFCVCLRFVLFFNSIRHADVCSGTSCADVLWESLFSNHSPIALGVFVNGKTPGNGFVIIRKSVERSF